MLSLTPVTSSTLKAVSHQGSVLWVLFQSGKLYRFDGVPQSVFDQLIQAPSKGKFFGATIKNVYSCTESSEQYVLRSGIALRDLLPGLSFGF